MRGFPYQGKRFVLSAVKNSYAEKNEGAQLKWRCLRGRGADPDGGRTATDITDLAIESPKARGDEKRRRPCRYA